MPTERLYYRDSYLREFTARLARFTPGEGVTEAVLDRTAFYPEGGGQPWDLGTLGGVPVVGVVERDGEVVHLLQGEPGAGELLGRVDWDRRFDHMQQHSGQHVLSQAFTQLLGADTLSFHMGEESSSIELGIAGLSAEQVARVEDLSNQVVFEDRPILVHMVDPGDLSRFQLRKGTDRTEEIRIVEVERFEAIPCGGTHCRSTGEIGTIKVVRWNRRGGNAQVEFLCGWRALRDYRQKNDAVMGLAAGLSVKDRDLKDAVERLMGEAAESRRQAEHLKNRILDYRAEELAEQGVPIGTARVIALRLDEYGPEELKHLAGRIVARPGRVALLASGADKLHLVFGRSEEVVLDAGALLRKVSAPFGGRGGGRPNMAQGGLPDAAKAGELLDLAVEEVRSSLTP